MKRASQFFTDYEKQRIEQAVAEAEAKTAAEIVPAVATASGRYDRAEDVIGLWSGAILMCITWAAGRSGAEGAHWGAAWTRFELPLLVLALVAGFIVGSFLAARVQWLRRIFTPRAEMRDEVAQSAARAFFDQRVHHTTGASGLLIYLSLFERTAHILADALILQKLGQPALDDLCRKLVEGIKAGDPATALCDVIHDAGERLAAVLPRESQDRNEIANALVILD